MRYFCLVYNWLPDMTWWEADDRHPGSCARLPTGAVDSHQLLVLILRGGPELCLVLWSRVICWYYNVDGWDVYCGEKLLLSPVWRIMGIEKNNLQDVQFELEKFCVCNLCYLLYRYPSVAIWAVFVSKDFWVSNRSLFVVMNPLCPWALSGLRNSNKVLYNLVFFAVPQWMTSNWFSLMPGGKRNFGGCFIHRLSQLYFLSRGFHSYHFLKTLLSIRCGNWSPVLPSISFLPLPAGFKGLVSSFRQFSKFAH